MTNTLAMRKKQDDRAPCRTLSGPEVEEVERQLRDRGLLRAATAEEARSCRSRKLTPRLAVRDAVQCRLMPSCSTTSSLPSSSSRTDHPGLIDTHVPASRVPGRPRLAILTPSNTTNTSLPSFHPSILHSLTLGSLWRKFASAVPPMLSLPGRAGHAGSAQPTASEHPLAQPAGNKLFLLFDYVLFRRTQEDQG